MCKCDVSMVPNVPSRDEFPVREEVATDGGDGFFAALQKLLTKLGDIFVAPTHETSPPLASVFERDYTKDADRRENYPQVRYKSTDTTEDLSLLHLDDTMDHFACERLSNKLQDALRRARQRYLQCNLVVPDNLTQKIARDVMRMSDNEPCGLRGCLIHTVYEDSDVCKQVGRVNYDPDTVNTFELTLTLRRDRAAWLNTLRALLPFSGCSGQKTVTLSSGYRLVKKKLYRLGDKRSEVIEYPR
ncbi:DNA damage-inducible transcript 4-like protein [Branchiostoma lanceolatum]|uniref:DNA damage-inducible transcript 4-like protein n=1 Tax=Branchiostoma lanceolatum TaxID=7740 RepID=UPI0034529302